MLSSRATSLMQSETNFVPRSLRISSGTPRRLKISTNAFATICLSMFFSGTASGKRVEKSTSVNIYLCPPSFGALIGSHVQYTQTDTIRQFRWSIGTNGRIGTNRKECHSNGSVGEYASH